MLDRRRFLRQMAGAGAVAGAWAAGALALRNRRLGHEAAPPPRTLPRFDVAVPAGRPHLVVCHGRHIDRMVRAALEAMGGLAAFIAPADRVVLKPNVAFDRAPELGATTAPDLVGCVVRLCFEAGAAAVTVVDHPINHRDAAGCFERTGIREAAERAGAVVRYPQPWSFTAIGLAGTTLDRWPAYVEPLARADKVIGLAPVKDHNLAGLSAVMKNWYGLLGGRRDQLHQRLDEVIADLAQLVRPTLVIADARRLLVSNGPTGGSLADVRPTPTIIVGTDPVAVDTYAAGLLGKPVASIGYLARAEARGLGTRAWRTDGFREIHLGG